MVLIVIGVIILITIGGMVIIIGTTIILGIHHITTGDITILGDIIHTAIIITDTDIHIMVVAIMVAVIMVAVIIMVTAEEVCPTVLLDGVVYHQIITQTYLIIEAVIQELQTILHQEEVL